jgi:hypothetical protein
MILKVLNHSAFAIVQSCNYYYAHVTLSEKCLFKEHGSDWPMVRRISCIPGRGDPESYSGSTVLHSPIVLRGGHIAQR